MMVVSMVELLAYHWVAAMVDYWVESSGALLAEWTVVHWAAHSAADWAGWWAGQKAAMMAVAKVARTDEMKVAHLAVARVA